jgi:polyhydroxyalkanoate synthesis regulator phasin
MRTLDDLMTEIEEASTQQGLARDERLSRLRSIREDLAEAIDDVDARIADVEASTDGQVDVTLAISRLRESADIRDELIEKGTISAEEADEDGVLSNDELDAMQEEGILEAAALELVAAGKLTLSDDDQDD